MHIYLRTDVGPRIIACEEFRARIAVRAPICTHAPARAAGSASVDLFGGDGGERGRKGGQLQRVSARASLRWRMDSR